MLVGWQSSYDKTVFAQAGNKPCAFAGKSGILKILIIPVSLNSAPHGDCMNPHVIRSFIALFCLISSLNVLQSSFLRAQAGALVPCFTTGTGFNGNSNSYAQLPTGKILCAGAFTTYNGSAANRICRLNADGSLDATFVGNIPNNEINCMTVLSNGQILISGSFTAPKFGIVRLNADGSVDATFNMSGTGIDNGRIQSFAVQPDGKIVIVGGLGFSAYNGITVNSIARLNADGTLDAAFNSGLGSGFNGGSFNAAAAVQPDGKILVGGNFTTYKGAAVPTGIIRLNSDGSRDNTFNPGSTGGVTGSVGFPIIVLPNSQILICGNFSMYNTSPRNSLARLNADGSLDNTFNPAGPSPTGVTMAQLPDGRLLVTGNFTTYDGVARGSVALASSNGVLDPSFSPVGSPGTVWSCFVLSDGTAILGGLYNPIPPGFTQYNGTTVNGIARIWLTTPVSLASSSPQRNTNNNALSTPLNLNFTQSMNAVTASQSAFRVWGGQTGLRSGTYSGSGTSTIGFTPAQAYKPGELVSATLMCGAQTSMGAPAAPSVMQFRAKAGAGPATFYETRTLATMSNSLYDLTCGYFNSDVYLDYAVSNITAFGGLGGVEIFLGSASGTFTYATTVSTGSPFVGLAVADMNNDGTQDIIAAGGGYAGAFTINVFLNNGSASFTPLAPTSPVLQQTQVDIATGDFDGDGDLDVFAVSDFASAGGYAIYRNDGTGVLSITATQGTGAGNGFLGASSGDIDNDGDIDIVYNQFYQFGSGAGYAHILINDGKGNFSPGQTINVGPTLYFSRLADLDNDGWLDLVTEQSGSSVLKIYKNMSGIFAGPTQTINVGNPNLGKMVTLDGNGDGYLDIAVTVGPAPGVVFVPNNAGTFGTAVTTSLLLGAGSLGVGDTDGDGDLDLLTTGNQCVTVLTNGIQPVITSTTPVRNSHTFTPTSLTASWNVAMTTATAILPAPASVPHSLYVWGSMTGYRALPSTASATQSGSTTMITPTKPFLPGETVSVSIPNARSSEFVPAKPVVYDFRAKAGVGPGTFQPGQIFSPPFVNSQKPILADLNNDGRLDFAVPQETGGNKIDIFFAGAGGTFSAAPSLVLNTLAPPKNIIAADFNNDGIVDIAAVNYGTNQTIELWIPPTPGAFPAAMPNFTITGGCLGARNIAAADMNGDGNLDIVSGCDGADNINVWLGNGNGSFQPVVAVSSGVGMIGSMFVNDIALGDFDNDGDIDLVCTNDVTNRMRIMLNQGNGTFLLGSLFSGVNYHTLALADFNDDGNLDIAVSAYGVNQVRVLLGDGTGAFPIMDSYAAGSNIRGITAADFNGDGRMDIAVAGFGLQQKFTVLLRNSSAYTVGSAFAGFVTYNSNCVQTHDILSGDIDGDGDMDILVQGGNAAALHINAASLSVVTTNPTRNAPSAIANSAVALTYSQSMTTATASVPALNIWGGFSGYKTGGTRSVAGSTVTANVGGFRPGEQVWVTHKNAQSTANINAKPYVYGFTAKAGVGPATFSQTSTPIVGADARTVASADFDGDGDLDLAVGSPAQVDILLNDGTGAFTTGSPILSGSLGLLQPWTVTAGDFNNDGFPDLAVTGTGGSSAVYILLNNANGTGTFTVSSNYVTGIGQCWHLTSADIDGDGDLDLLVANTTGTTVNILLNNGAGTFTAGANLTPTFGSNPRCVAVADFDNDGDLDLAVGNITNYVNIWLNNGNGTFTAAPDITTGLSSPVFVAAGDLNADGAVDLAIVNAGSTTVSVFTNSGAGVFTQALGSPFSTFSTNPVWVSLEDFDGNGTLDIATVNYAGTNISILRNTGSASFSNITTYPALNAPNYLAAGDFDGDGDLDVAVTNSGFGSVLVSILKNATQVVLTAFSPPRNAQTLTPTTPVSLTYNQSMTTATASVQPFRAWGSFRGFRSGTYSQPGDAATAQITLSPPLWPNEEVFVSVTNAQNANRIAARPISLQYRTGAASAPATFFASAPVQVGAMPSTIRRSVALDYNGDGFVDIAFVNDAANAVQIMQGSASGGFTLGPLVGLGGGTQPNYLAVGDFNSDGQQDMVVSCFGGGGTVSVLMNTGGAFNASSSPPTGARQIAVADFNSDGAMDFAVMCAGAGSVNIYFGKNNGTFSAPTTLISAASGGRGIAAADFDNDGRVDILTFSPSVPINAAVYFRNNGIAPNGTATFDNNVNLSAFGTNEAPEVAQIGDFNGDGNMDVVTSALGSSIQTLFTVWLGNGTGGFTATNYGVGSINNFELTTGDFNGDGRLDIAVGNAQGNIEIWMNSGSGTFILSGIANGAKAAFPVAADIDSDGDLDLLATNGSAQFISFYNQTAPILTASPLLLDFGTLTVGQSITQTAAISGINLVDAVTIGITRATVSAYSYSVNAGAFATQGTVAVAGGSTLTVNVQARFTPVTSGTFSTTITVTTASATPLVLTLTGFAVLPRIPTPPVIMTLSTNAALIGTPVTVSGLNFTNVSQASIGGISTTVNILSATQANVIVPTGLSIGQVILTNIDGTAVSRDSVRALVPYTPPPVVTAAAPLVGVAGEFLIVTGANFATGATTVLIGGAQVSSTFLSTTQLTVVLQIGMQGVIGVRTPNGSTTSSLAVRVIPPPTIQSITPTQASNGETFTIFGTNFINVLSVTAANMRLDSTSWEIDSLRQRLTARVIENLAENGTIGTITILTRSGKALFTQAYNAGGDPILAATPRIYLLTPSVSGAPLQEGDEITLAVADVSTTATQALFSLTVNGVRATISSVTLATTGATVRLRLPPGIVPTNLRSSSSLAFVLSIGSITTTATFSQTVQAAFLPTFTTFTPPLGGTCSTITITGQNLGIEPRGRVLDVLVGGASVQAFRVVSPTRIQATLGTVRSGVVTVLTSVSVLSTSAMFSFDPNFQCLPPMRREDSLALDAFYVATVGLDWTTSTNWTVQGVPAAMRFGVKVEGDRVVEIRMPKNNVSGSIPEFVMQNLRTLRALDLGNNRVGGALPQALAQAPNLEILRLGQNRFTGILPQNLASLTRLRELDLSDNLLADTLGQCWTLTGLESLNLSGNRFTGRMSRDVARLVNLLTLDLSRNLLSDSVPPEVGTLQLLKVLRLSGNRLTGRIPTTLGVSSTPAKTALLAATPNLVNLDLSNNQLSGTIPAELGTLTNLRELLLNGNTLSGEIPSTLAKLTTLQTLDVERNQLLESPSFVAIPRLTLRLADNRFDFGTIESQVPMRPSAGAQQQVLSTSIFSYTTQSPDVRISDRTDTSVALDASLRLRVAARGANNRYAWWKDNILIQATSPSATLLIPSVAPGDSGSYKCVISNTLLPDLTLTTPPLRVTTFTPAFPPQDSIVLIAPVLAAEDVSPIPTFVWTSAAGARQYRLEVSGTPTFATLLASVSVPQTTQALTSGRVEFSAQGTIGFPLASSARIFWRVRAENTRGAGNPTSSDFTTAAGDALLTVDRLDFGRIPRGDTATRLLTIRNISTQTLRIENLTAASTVFRAGLQRAFTLAPGRDTTVSTVFLPAALGDVQSALTTQFRAVDANGLPSGALQTQTFQGRLRGRGGALKLISPVFDTIPVRTTKIVSALLINVSGSPLEINSLTIVRGGEGFTLRAGGIQRVEMAATDTLVIPVSCSTEQANKYLRDTLRVQTTLERIDAPLEAFSRNRTPKDVAVNLGIRPQQNNLPPGSAVTMEIFIVPSGNATLDSVFNAANPFIKGIIRADKNVLALSPNETFVRVQQLDTNRMIRFIVPATTWNPRTNVVAQFQCVVVAGNTDYTALKIEDVQWGTGNVILDSLLDSSFTARTSRAGGKRLISSGSSTQLTAIAPNPAKDEIEISYTIAEIGLVSITLLDAPGNETIGVLNEVQTAGKHTLRVKVGWLASGMYHVRLRTTNETTTQQVNIVK